MWWNDLGKGSRETVVKIQGGLVGLLNIKPRLDIIEALIPFWDPTRNVFRFSDFELTPTLEEMAGYAGLNGNLRGRYPLAPRPVTLHRFLDLLSDSRDIQDKNLSEGYCTLHFLYHRCGNPQGFEEPNTGLTHAGNKDKWEARRGLAFMVAFLGVVICPRKDGHIDIGLVGILDVAIKKSNSTVVPLIVAEIYRALTMCREGEKFFQGCNLLLQLWIQEHLCHRTGYMNYGLTGLSCIEEFKTRVTGIEFLEGTEAWLSCLRSLTADKIEWAFGWLPVAEAVYTSAEVPYILLMGIRSIQPYAPHRVLRQLGRFQTVHNDEDLSKQIIELGPKDAFPEGKIRKIWNECRFLEPKTIVRDRARGEVDPKYMIWFGKRFQISERPAKRPHVQQFTDGTQVQWDWLAKDKEYRARIGKLEQQVQDLQFEKSVQAATDGGDKKKLTQENEVLKAQIRQMKIAAKNQERSRYDERLINGLKKQVLECQEELEKSEGNIAKIRAQWAKKQRRGPNLCSR
ncbi:PREDICTED: uncharacterized protein LOC109238585 [Nicotiana attenuata]|uniref:uncharacterized protein LOC109238585 n=1 Tax=Nicotiana attenuata TaxID=49451 RepID=UPI0009056270|nr:PREDICTED: uncharacterized protein LOC109238585 [Nicotiana attenuata]